MAEIFSFEAARDRRRELHAKTCGLQAELEEKLQGERATIRGLDPVPDFSMFISLKVDLPALADFSQQALSELRRSEDEERPSDVLFRFGLEWRGRPKSLASSDIVMRVVGGENCEHGLRLELRAVSPNDIQPLIQLLTRPPQGGLEELQKPEITKAALYYILRGENTGEYPEIQRDYFQFTLTERN